MGLERSNGFIQSRHVKISKLFNGLWYGIGLGPCCAEKLNNHVIFLHLFSHSPQFSHLSRELPGKLSHWLCYGCTTPACVRFPTSPFFIFLTSFVQEGKGSGCSNGSEFSLHKTLYQPTSSSRHLSTDLRLSRIRKKSTLMPNAGNLNPKLPDKEQELGWPHKGQTTLREV